MCKNLGLCGTFGLCGYVDFGTFGIADNRRSMFFFYIHYMIFLNKNAKYIKNYATTNQECMTCIN